MSLSMYQASVPAFVQMLNNLSAILDKAEADAKNRKIDPEVLLNYRLAADMLPFIRQVQISADLAKGAVARLAGVEVPKHDDTEKTFANLKARLGMLAIDISVPRMANRGVQKASVCLDVIEFCRWDAHACIRQRG
jgi:hypothetical protein